MLFVGYRIMSYVLRLNSRASKNVDQIDLKCSFCKKDYKQVTTLISGPDGVTICNDCIDLCNEIIKMDQIER